MITVTHKLRVATTMLMLTLPLQVIYSESDYEPWQLKSLFKQSNPQLKIKIRQKDKVFINEKLKDTDANRIMQEQSDQAFSMRLVGTVITGEDRRSIKDQETGLNMKEDDGC